MEDLLIAFFQALLELLAYAPWDLFTYCDFGSEDRDFLIGILSLMAGGVVGGASLLLLPDVLAKWPWLRVSLLAVTPFLSGFLAYQLAALRQRRGWKVAPIPHFWFSWLFTVGLTVVRFTFAHRPG